jgi:hypothetical protein
MIAALRGCKFALDRGMAQFWRHRKDLNFGAMEQIVFAMPNGDAVCRGVLFRFKMASFPALLLIPIAAARHGEWPSYRFQFIRGA